MIITNNVALLNLHITITCITIFFVCLYLAVPGGVEVGKDLYGSLLVVLWGACSVGIGTGPPCKACFTWVLAC